MKTVSLIIPAGGGGATIKRLIRSTYLIEGVELKYIVIVEQGGYSATDWLRKLEETNKNIYVIFNPNNIPPPVPYNDGLELLNSIVDKTDFIHFLDDDMEILDGSYLSKMIEFYDKNDLGIMSSEHCYFGPRPIPDSGEVPDFGMGAFLFRKEIFEKLGYLDERYKFHCADSDYVRRVKQLLKKKIAILPGSQPMLKHFHQLGTRKKFEGRHQPVIDNDWVIYDKKWKEEVKLEFQEREVMNRSEFWSEKCKQKAM